MAVETRIIVIPTDSYDLGENEEFFNPLPDFVPNVAYRTESE